jgi:hypothetical protein
MKLIPQILAIALLAMGSTAFANEGTRVDVILADGTATLTAAGSPHVTIDGRVFSLENADQSLKVEVRDGAFAIREINGVPLTQTVLVPALGISDENDEVVLLVVWSAEEEEIPPPEIDTPDELLSSATARETDGASTAVISKHSSVVLRKGIPVMKKKR